LRLVNYLGYLCFKCTYMNKTIVLLFVVLGVMGRSQSIGSSPYAIFGLGDVKYNNDIGVSSMGGVSVAHVSDFINSFNFVNPAANFNLELTSIRGQISNENVKYKSNQYDGTKHSTYMSGISLALPVSQKVKLGFGFQPYSSKTYQVATSEEKDSGNIKTNNFTGEGSINTLEGAISYKLMQGLGIGIKTNYYFGKISDTEEISQTNVLFTNGYRYESRMSGFNFTLGGIYQYTTDLDYKFTVGGTYQFGTFTKLKTKYVNSTYLYAKGMNDKINESIIEEGNRKSDNVIPQSFSAGLGYGKDGRWFVSTQMDKKTSSSVNITGTPFKYKDSYKLSAGGWFIPDPNDFRNYFSRIIYRYGIFYEETGLNIHNRDINSRGFTIGMNLPIKPAFNSLSSIDFSLEIGRRGSFQNNLVQEGFVNLKVGFNFADRWFMKNLYN